MLFLHENDMVVNVIGSKAFISLIYRSATTQNKEVLHEQTRTSEQVSAFYRGQWRDASDGEFFTTKCPANGEKLAECAQAAKEDVDDAVREAWKAFETWKKVPTSERAAILNKIADIIDANTEHLAMVESLDNGKPIRETMAIDIPLSAKHFRYFAGCITAEEAAPIYWMSSSFP